MGRRQVLIIAHRGASAMAPESTQAAIQAAVRIGVDMIELDVQLTRDQRVVIFHDDRVDRTTNGQGRVSRMSYAQLSRLDAGAWFHPRFAEERILLVSQALRAIPEPVRINLEIKRTPHPQLVIRKLLQAIRETATSTRVLLSSFDAHPLRLLKGTRVPRALICQRRPDEGLDQAIALGCQAWHPRHSLVTARRIDRAHAAGLRVHAWTVDERSRARWLIRQGIDGFFTNDPVRLIRLGSTAVV